jgi:hypothetical protein
MRMWLVKSEDEVEAGSQTARFKMKGCGAVYKAGNLQTVLLDLKR